MGGCRMSGFILACRQSSGRPPFSRAREFLKDRAQPFELVDVRISCVFLNRTFQRSGNVRLVPRSSRIPSRQIGLWNLFGRLALSNPTPYRGPPF
jgi:hypothetical protein